MSELVHLYIFFLRNEAPACMAYPFCNKKRNVNFKRFLPKLDAHYTKELAHSNPL